MSDDVSFRDLIGRVRGGDQDAATDLVGRYEPAIRRAIRIRLVDGRLRTMLDSMDVCQSVMASFFCRAALGQYDLERPEDLLRLLTTMARNKLADQARRQATNRRGRGMARVGTAEQVDVADPEAGPGTRVAAREVLEMAWARLTDDERWLADQRAQGRPWADLAVEAGQTPEGLRKKHARALERVARQLDLDGPDGEC